MGLSRGSRACSTCGGGTSSNSVRAAHHRCGKPGFRCSISRCVGVCFDVSIGIGTSNVGACSVGACSVGARGSRCA